MTTQINWLGWIGSLLLMAILPVLASLPPWLNEPLRSILFHAFDPICHQIAERSPHYGGGQLAVCHRCYGILVGLAAGPIIALIFRAWNDKIGHILVIASLTPLILDWGLGVLQIWENTAESRFITGSIFGVIAGVLVARAMAWYRADSKTKGNRSSREDPNRILNAINYETESKSTG